MSSDSWKAIVDTYHSKSLGHNLDMSESGPKMKKDKLSLKLRSTIEQARKQVVNDGAALETCGETSGNGPLALYCYIALFVTFYYFMLPFMLLIDLRHKNHL